jgi:cytochrome c biogenesis protein CcmG, thiol:disulfide interchange protein DsbE
MKTFTLILILIAQPFWLSAQNNFPDVSIRNLNGEIISSTEIFTNNQATVLIFWKSYDTKCCENLDNMQSAWLSQLKENGVKLVGICVDGKGSWSHINPVVSGKAWDFDIYIDNNGDFKRALSVTDAPYTILFDTNQYVLCRHEGYCNGNEYLVCKKILECLSKTGYPLAQKAE